MQILNRAALGRLALTLAMIVFLVSLAALDGNAGERLVTVNGQVLSAKQLAMLDRLAGSPVPDGSYWIDPDSATWGFAGDPTPRGNIGRDQADQGQGDRDGAGMDVYIGTFSPYRRDSGCILIGSTTTIPC